MRKLMPETDWTHLLMHKGGSQSGNTISDGGREVGVHTLITRYKTRPKSMLLGQKTQDTAAMACMFVGNPIEGGGS